ncbi:MAG: hypothetical protein ACETWM_21475 [Candidatus Lokiarchaeia archaeon]
MGFEVGNRWKIVLFATGFNLLFEYSMRGINNLVVQPVLPLILFTAYFTYFTMLEDLIVRYRLKDYHLIVASFFFGTVYVCLVSGAAFSAPRVLGINWGSLLFINLVWWGALQAVMTLYIANRVVPRDWDHPLLSKTGWGVMLFLNGMVVLLFQLSGVIPQGTLTGIIVMSIILVITAVIFWRILPEKSQRPSYPDFERSRAMDYLSVATAFIFFVCAVFLIFDPTKLGASNVNLLSVQIVLVWTTILAIIMLVYRLYSKRAISV